MLRICESHIEDFFMLFFHTQAFQWQLPVDKSAAPRLVRAKARVVVLDSGLDFGHNHIGKLNRNLVTKS